jgi:hypothetical protein
LPVDQRTPVAQEKFVPTVMPMLKGFVNKTFRRKNKRAVYENGHMLYDDVRFFTENNLSRAS